MARGIFVAACELLVAACMWDLVPRPGIEPGPPALVARSLTHWTTREIPQKPIIKRWFMGKFLLQLNQAHKQYRMCVTPKIWTQRRENMILRKYLDQVMTGKS